MLKKLLIMLMIVVMLPLNVHIVYAKTTANQDESTNQNKEETTEETTETKETTKETTKAATSKTTTKKKSKKITIKLPHGETKKVTMSKLKKDGLWLTADQKGYTILAMPNSKGYNSNEMGAVGVVKWVASKGMEINGSTVQVKFFTHDYEGCYEDFAMLVSNMVTMLEIPDISEWTDQEVFDYFTTHKELFSKMDEYWNSKEAKDLYGNKLSANLKYARWAFAPLVDRTTYFKGSMAVKFNKEMKDTSYAEVSEVYLSNGKSNALNLVRY